MRSALSWLSVLARGVRLCFRSMKYDQPRFLEERKHCAKNFQFGKSLRVTMVTGRASAVFRDIPSTFEQELDTSNELTGKRERFGSNLAESLSDKLFRRDCLDRKLERHHITGTPFSRKGDEVILSPVQVSLFLVL